MEWPAAIFRAAQLEIVNSLSMERDGPAVLAETLASVATVLGAKKGESVPPEAMSETVARSPSGQDRLRLRQERKLRPRPPLQLDRMKGAS